MTTFKNIIPSSQAHHHLLIFVSPTNYASPIIDNNTSSPRKKHPREGQFFHNILSTNSCNINQPNML